MTCHLLVLLSSPWPCIERGQEENSPPSLSPHHSGFKGLFKIPPLLFLFTGEESQSFNHPSHSYPHCVTLFVPFPVLLCLSDTDRTQLLTFTRMRAQCGITQVWWSSLLRCQHLFQHLICIFDPYCSYILTWSIYSSLKTLLLSDNKQLFCPCSNISISTG